MIERTVTIRNKDGIHCRPSSEILTAVQDYTGHEFLVSSDNGESDLSSILGLLGLGIQCNEKITIKVSGPDENEVADKLAELFEREFDFPSQ